MKKRKLAIVLAFAMIAASVPIETVAVSAEEIQDGFVSGEESDTEDASTENEEDTYGMEEDQDADSDPAELSDGFVSEDNIEEAATDDFVDAQGYNDEFGGDGLEIGDENEYNTTTVKIGESAEIRAFAISNHGEITYQWWKIKEVGKDISPVMVAEGKDCNVYKTDKLETATYYECKISDGNETKSTYWIVNMDTGFITSDTYSVTVEPGESAVLSPGGYTELGKLTYQWYDGGLDGKKHDLIPGATKAEYAIDDVISGYYYYCLVSDGYNESEIICRTYVDSYLEVEADGNRKIYVEKNKTALLKVKASSKCPLQYQWYRKSGEEEIAISGATSAEFQIPAVADPETIYICKVSDEYNSESVDFTVRLDTKLTVEAEKIIYVPESEPVELKVSANCEEEYKPLKYQWYIEFDGKEIIEGATDPVLKYRYYDVPVPYSCTVTDAIGNTKSVYIYTCPEKYKAEFAPDFEHAKEFIPGEKDQAYVGISWGCYFKFVPDQTGTWKFSTPAGVADSEIIVYNSNKDRMNSVYADRKEAVSLDVKLQKGLTYYICCYSLDEEITYTLSAECESKCNHKWDKVVVDKQPTCAAAGSQHIECSVCGEKQAATAIPATGKHSFGDYKVTKASTVLAAGVKTRTCKVCGKTETAAVAKLNGTIKVVSAKVPLQVKKSVALSKLVTGLTTGDSINAAACTSSKPAVAAIRGGKVVAKKAGTAVITVKLASGTFAKVTIVVQKGAVATASISVPTTLKLKAGEKKKLTPVVKPVTSLNKVTYSSTNTKVATVSKDGTVTAKKSGSATIKVKSGKKTVNVKVKVAKNAPTGMSGVPASKTLKKSKSFTIKPKLTPSGAEATIKYTSSNKRIVTVSSKGKVTAKKAGKATITVKAGNVTKKCVVTVKK